VRVDRLLLAGGRAVHVAAVAFRGERALPAGQRGHLGRIHLERADGSEHAAGEGERRPAHSRPFGGERRHDAGGCFAESSPNQHGAARGAGARRRSR
jgi:hypothetical protein